MNSQEKLENPSRTVWPGRKPALRRLALIALFLVLLSWPVFALLVGDWRLNIGDGTQGEEETVRHLREWFFIMVGSISLVFLLSLLAPFQRLGCGCHWLLSGRRLRWCLIALAWLVTAAALFYAEEDWRGGRAWSAYRHQLEADGAQLDFAAYIPKPIPDDENFAATPFVKSWFTEVNPSVVTNTTYRFVQLWHDNYERADASLVPPKAERNRRQFTDLVAWGMVFDKLRSGETNLPVQRESDQWDPASLAAAVPSVLWGLKTNATALAALAEASRRPQAQYPVVYDLDNPWGVYLPHLLNVKLAVQRLDLRACAELAGGHSDDALADIKLALYLSDTLKNESFLISYLVRIATIQMTAQPVWEGLAEHAWTDAQLQELETRLASYEFTADVQRPLAAERAVTLLTGELIKKKGLGYFILLVGPGSPTPMDTKFANWCGAFVPNGWYDLEELNYFRLSQMQLAGALDANQKRIFPERVKAGAAGLDRAIGGQQSFASAFLRHQAMARLMMGSFDKILHRTAEVQTVADQAALACALERYRLAKGQYPPTLAALTPALIAAVPTDIFDGEPYQYRPTDDGEFLLYSVGWNEKDDGGVPGKTLMGDDGDWVWNSAAK